MLTISICILLLFYGFTVECCEASENTVILNDGNAMPNFGFGTFVRLNEVNDTKRAVFDAIEVGYRSIDTSQLYFTEPGIGEALKEAISCGIVTRDEMFITSKFELGNTRDAVLSAIQKSLERLQLDYLDLYLIHSPYNTLTGQDFDIVELWRGMEDAQRMGFTKSIGVSNFNSTHINKLLVYTDVKPAVNEIEVHPAYANLELVAYCQSLDITVVAYSPHGLLVEREFRHLTAPPTFDNPVLVNLANKYGVSTNRIVLRYLMDRGAVPIPKSYTKEHTIDNYKAVNDPSLTEYEINLINEFNSNSKIFDLYSCEIVNDFFLYYYNQTLEEGFKGLGDQ